jgi:hypothetical protein
MERLYQLVLLFGAVVCFLGAAPPSAAKDYCSLRVRVLAPNGQRPEVRVTVREISGRKLEKRQGFSEDLEFCDLGIEPVTVVVGLKGCNQIVINDVPLSWQEPYTLKVTYDYEPCMQEKPPPPKPVCEVLFRVAGADEKWIDNAIVKIDEPALPQSQTDKAGRAFVIVGLNERLRGSVSAPGYSQKEFSFVCSETPHEEVVKLMKK